MSYIGQTKNKILKRIKAHITANSRIGEAIREYEIKNFKIEVIWEAINQKEADIVERAAIFAYNTRVPNGYNITPGGENCRNYKPIGMIGKRHTEEQRKKWSQDRKGKGNSMFERKRPDVIKRNKENKYNLGKKIPKISASLKGNTNRRGKKDSKETIEKKSKAMQGIGKDTKHPWTTKRNKENNCMKNPKTVLKRLITLYKNKIKKLEQELERE